MSPTPMAAPRRAAPAARPRTGPLESLRRRWWIPAAALALVAAAPAAAAWWRGPKYMAAGLVELRARLPRALQEVEPPTRAVLETHRRLLESNQVLDEALELLGRLPENPADRQWARMGLASCLRVRAGQKDFLVQVESYAGDPDEAKRVADAVMAAFVRFTDRFLGSVNQRRTTLREREARIAERLRALEAARDEALAKRGGTPAAAQLEEVTASWTALSQRAAELELQRVEQAAHKAHLAALLADLGDDADGKGDFEGLLQLAEPAEATALRARLAELRARLLHLERTVRPDRLETLPEHGQLKEQLRREQVVGRSRARAAARAALSRAEDRLAELARWTTDLSARGAELEKRLLALEVEARAEKAREDELAWFQTAAEQVRTELHRLDSAPQEGGARVVDSADRPTEPLPPIGLAALAMLGVMAAAGGVGLALGWEQLVPPFVAALELPRLGLRSLGRLPADRASWTGGPGGGRAGPAAAILAALDEPAPPRALLVTGVASDATLDAVARALAVQATSGGQAAVLGLLGGGGLRDAPADRLQVRSAATLRGDALAPAGGERVIVAAPRDDLGGTARRADAVLLVIEEGGSRAATLDTIDAVRAAGGVVAGVVTIDR